MGKTVKVDLTGVESFQRCAEGIHTVKIATAEVKQSQGGNDMIVIAFEVTKGVDKGARVYENFPLVDKALWKLKGLLQAIGMKADGKVSVDLDKLIGKICNINVQHEEYDGKLRARVESIMKFVAESSDEDTDDDEDGEVPFEEEDDDDFEQEEKSAKRSEKGKNTSKKAPRIPFADEDDDDWDDDDEEEEEKPAPQKKVESKKEKPVKKTDKKSKKDEDDDDDWDDDWDEDEDE